MLPPPPLLSTPTPASLLWLSNQKCGLQNATGFLCWNHAYQRSQKIFSWGGGGDWGGSGSRAKIGVEHRWIEPRAYLCACLVDALPTTEYLEDYWTVLRWGIEASDPIRSAQIAESMLARDYGCVGSKGSYIGAWDTKQVVEKLGCIGSDLDYGVCTKESLSAIKYVDLHTNDGWWATLPLPLDEP